MFKHWTNWGAESSCLNNNTEQLRVHLQDCCPGQAQVLKCFTDIDTSDGKCKLFCNCRAPNRKAHSGPNVQILCGNLGRKSDTLSANTHTAYMVTWCLPWSPDNSWSEKCEGRPVSPLFYQPPLHSWARFTLDAGAGTGNDEPLRLCWGFDT